MTTRKTYYLAGPMRGYPRFNFDAFDAFDAAAEDLRKRGFDILSPADLDREVDFDPDKDIPDQAFMTAAARRDIEAVFASDGVVLLPGWEPSIGACMEKLLAHMLGKEVLTYPDLNPLVIYNNP